MNVCIYFLSPSLKVITVDHLLINSVLFAVDNPIYYVCRGVFKMIFCNKQLQYDITTFPAPASKIVLHILFPVLFYCSFVQVFLYQQFD